MLEFVKIDTSFGEASSRTQATDPNRRETLRIRTPLPGLRGQAKWLATGTGSAPAIALRRGVPKLLRERCRGQGFLNPWRVFLMVSRSVAWRPRASRLKGGTRWTLIVRAEVGPSRCCPILLRAHASPARPPRPVLLLHVPFPRFPGR